MDNENFQVLYEHFTFYESLLGQAITQGFQNSQGSWFKGKKKLILFSKIKMITTTLLDREFLGNHSLKIKFVF